VKHFLLGVVTTLLVLAAGVLALLFVLGHCAGEVEAPPPPPASAAPPEAPSDLKVDETWLGTVDLSSDDVVSSDGELVDVRATGTGVRFSPSALHAQRLDVDATVPFDTVAAQVGPDVTISPAAGGLATIERTVTLLGRDVTVKATGSVKADGGQLLIEPETVDLGGPAFLDSAASALARTLVTIRKPVPGVPEGMALTDVHVTDAGFAARLSGENVTIGR
jgi:hypothetical protein